MKTYRGVRLPSGTKVTVDGKPLKKRLDLFRHSPDGFEWGYGGSGPAQLALAILADVLGDDERAVRLHQGFKFNVVASLEKGSWELTEDAVKEWVARQPKPDNSTPDEAA